MGLREQVGAQGPSRRVELLGIVPQTEEHLLHDLLRERPVDHDAQREAERRPGVAAVRLSERGLVEAADRDDELRIARIAVFVRSHPALPLEVVLP